MIHVFRRFQKTTLIIVTAIIVVAFAFLADYDSMRGLGGASCIVKIHDRCYRAKEVAKLGQYFDVAYALGMYEFAIMMFNERRTDRDPTDFIISLVAFRKAAEDLGIEPSSDEIKKAIPNLPIFQQPWVDTDYVKNNILGPRGFTEGDLAQLVKDNLCFQKIQELVGAGIESVPSEIDKFYIQQNQRYDVAVVDLDRSSFEDKVKLSDEDIQKYYDTNKAKLLSEEERGFDFVKFIPEKLAEDASNEAKAQAKLTFAQAVNQVYADLAEEGADFEAAAKRNQSDQKELKIEIGKHEAFSPDKAPEGLKEDNNQLYALFSGALQEGAVTVPFAQEDGSYYVYKLSKVVPPRELTLEEAKSAITTALKNSKSDELVNNAALEARSKLLDAAKSAKDVAALATATGLELKKVPNFSASEPPTETDNANLIINAVSGLGEKEVTEVISKPGGSGYMLAYVDRLQLYKSEDLESEKRSLGATRRAETKRTLFGAWLNQQRRAANAKRVGSIAAPSENAPIAPVSPAG